MIWSAAGSLRQEDKNSAARLYVLFQWDWTASMGVTDYRMAIHNGTRDHHICCVGISRSGWRQDPMEDVHQPVESSGDYFRERETQLVQWKQGKRFVPKYGREEDITGKRDDDYLQSPRATSIESLDPREKTKNERLTEGSTLGSSSALTNGH